MKLKSCSLFCGDRRNCLTAHSFITDNPAPYLVVVSLPPESLTEIAGALFGTWSDRSIGGGGGRVGAGLEEKKSEWSSLW